MTIKEDTLIEDIKYACKMSNFEFNYVDIVTELNKITTEKEAYAYADDSTNLLWQWIPAIVLAKFGLQIYKSDIWSKKAHHQSSFILMHPVFEEYNESVLNIIPQFNLYIKRKKIIPYSPQVIAYCYGGFPWFKSYHQVCLEYNSLNKNTTCYEIYDPEDTQTDVIGKLRDFKNLCRNTIAPEIKIDKEPYPGIIRVFHSPEYIEIAQFRKNVFGESSND